MLLSEQIEQSVNRIESEIEFLRKLVEEVKKLENNQKLNKQNDRPTIAKKLSKKEH
jgi:methyl coenzyme M reductase subunit C-like uncharacterized protein (methanogenesis marker protein 7)